MFAFPSILWRTGWRFLTRHAWQSGLMILGVALGVAVVVAVDLANLSAARSFELSAEAVAGKATHRITGGPLGLDERVYTDLRREGLEIPLAPIMRNTVVSPQLGNRPLQLFGIDPFAEAPFRSYLGGEAAPPVEQLATFLVTPGAVFMTTTTAERYSLVPGDPLVLEIDGWQREAVVAGLLEPADALSRRTLDGMLLADIATAQELIGRIGRLDQIDVLVDPAMPDSQQAEALDILRRRLPEGVILEPAASRSEALEQLTGAFRVNLTALSLLALLVGIFLIYNTMTFSVVQRRAQYGTLRCLGVTRREIFLLVAGEAMVVGIIGSAVGAVLGVLLSRTTTAMILQTINDLYFSTTVQSIGIPPAGLIKGIVTGVLATLLAALAPAWEAAATSPRMALLRSNLEGKAQRFTHRTSYAGAALVLAGLGLFALPLRDLVSGFAGTLMVVVGFALQAGVSLQGLARLTTPLLARLFGYLGKMAPRSLRRSLSRTAIAIAALMVAVSVTVGVGLMIQSFRYTVIAWLAQTLQGDIYISAPTQTATHTTTAVDPSVVRRLGELPGVRRVDLLRQVQLDTAAGPIQISATDNPASGSERLFLRRDGSPEEIWDAMQAGAVILSEPLANRLDMPARGGSLTLDTPSGRQDFPVVGIFYDYTSSQGVLVMALDVYRKLWGDLSITAAALRLWPEVEADAFTVAVEDELASEQRLVIRSNRVLKEEVLQVFDRTFAITRSLQVLTTVVAFIGVLNALLLLQLEKASEVGILRAIGLTPSQLRRLVFLETGLMGLAAGVLAMPTGYVLSLILIYVINRRSFGWTLQTAITAEPFLLALGIAIVAALLAGLYPARRLSRIPASEAIRYE